MSDSPLRVCLPVRGDVSGDLVSDDCHAQRLAQLPAREPRHNFVNNRPIVRHTDWRHTDPPPPTATQSLHPRRHIDTYSTANNTSIFQHTVSRQPCNRHLQVCLARAEYDMFELLWLAKIPPPPLPTQTRLPAPGFSSTPLHAAVKDVPVKDYLGTGRVGG